MAKILEPGRDIIPRVDPKTEPFPGFTRERATLTSAQIALGRRQEVLSGEDPAPTQELDRTAADVAIQPTIRPGPPPLGRPDPLGLIDKLKIAGASFLNTFAQFNPTGLNPPAVVPTIKTPEFIAQEVLRQTQIKEASLSIVTEAKSLNWRRHILEIIPNAVQGDNPLRTPEQLLAQYGVDGLSSEDIQWASIMMDRAVRQLAVRDRPKMTEDRRDQIIAQVGRQRSASIYGVLLGSSRDLLETMIEISQPKLPEGVTAAEQRALLADAGFGQDELQAELDAMQDNLTNLRESLVKNDARLAVMQSSLANTEIDVLERMITDRVVRDMLSKPLAFMLIPANYYIDNVTKPLSGAFIRHIAGVKQDPILGEVPLIGGALGRVEGIATFDWLKPSEQELHEFTRIYEQASASPDFNSWEALGYAFENHHANGFKKFMTEVLVDPISYFGFGMYANIVRPIPKVGPVLAGIETGFMRGTDLAFLGLKRGMYHAVPKPLDAVLAAETRAALGVVKASVETFSARNTGMQRVFRDIPLEEAQEALRQSMGAQKANPGVVDDFTAAGRILRTRDPVTAEQAADWARRLGVDGLDANQILQLDDLLGQTMGLDGRVVTVDEAASLMLDVARTPKPENLPVLSEVGTIDEAVTFFEELTKRTRHTETNIGSRINDFALAESSLDVSLDRVTRKVYVYPSTAIGVRSQVAHEIAHAIHIDDPSILKRFSSIHPNLSPRNQEEFFAEAFEEFVTQQPKRFRDGPANLVRDTSPNTADIAQRWMLREFPELQGMGSVTPTPTTSKAIIQEVVDQVDTRALAIVDDASSVPNLYSRVFDHVRANTEAGYRSSSVPTKIQQAAMGAPIAQAGARLTAIWANHLDKVSRGAARMYLMFTFYSPFNVMENGSKTIYAGLNPMYEGNQARELVFRTTGLSGRQPVFEEAAGVTLELGSLPISDTLRAVKGKLPFMSDNAYRRASRRRLTAWQKFYGGLEEALINTGAKVGLQQQGNYLNRGIARELWRDAPDVMSTVDRIIQEEASTLAAGVDAKVIRQVTKEAELRATTLADSLSRLGDDFTPGKVRAAKVRELVSQYPDIGPTGSDHIIAKLESDQLFPQLSQTFDDVEELIMQEVLHGPELGRQRLNSLVDALMENPPTTQAEFDSYVQTLHFITENAGDLIHTQLRATKEYTDNILNRAVKVRIHDEMWEGVLAPFIKDSGERVEQYVTMLKGAIESTSRQPSRFRLRRVEIDPEEVPVIEPGTRAVAYVVEDLEGNFVTKLNLTIGDELGSAEVALFGSDVGDLGVSAVRQLGRELTILHPEITEFRGVRIGGGGQLFGPEQVVPASVFEARPSGLGLDDATRTQYEQLLDQHLRHFALIREVRLEQMNLTQRLTSELKTLEAKIRASGGKPTTTHPEIEAWWREFDLSRDALWERMRSPMAESSAETLESQARTGNLPLGKIRNVSDGELTLAHISELFNSVPTDLSRGLYIPEIGAFKDRLLWVEQVYARAKTVMARDQAVSPGTLPEALGFTKPAIGQVYDEILQGMRQSPGVAGVAGPRIAQVQALKRELISLGQRSRSLLPQQGRASLKKFGDRVRSRLRTEAPELFDDSWRTRRQRAFDRTSKQFELDFPDYTSATAVNAVGRAIFPFWTYETHRMFWLARSFVRTPGMQASLAKYQDYTDNGYVRTPLGGWEVNFLRGTIWMGGMRRLIQRDYPDFYDRVPGLASAFDQMSRFGFYPNIFISGSFAAFGAATGQSQLGEIIPPLIQTPLEAYIAARPDSASAKTILEQLMPNRFRDYQVSQAVGKLGGPGLDILTKRVSGTKLTEDDEAWWAKGQREVAQFNLVNIHMGLLRFRPEERLKFERDARRVISECTGITEAVQEQAQRAGLRLEEFIGVPFECKEIVRELEGFTQFRGASGYLQESELGQTLAIYRQFWDEVERESNSTSQAQYNLDSEWLSGLRDRQWWLAETRKLNERVHQVIQDKQADPRFISEVDGEDVVIPLTLDERKEWSKLMGYDPILMDVESELIALYFQVELEERLDPEIGQITPDWDRFFLTRQMIAGAVPPSRQESFNKRIRGSESPLERHRREDYEQYVRPYQNTFDLVLSQLPEDDQAVVRRANATDDVDERRELLAETNDAGDNIVSQFQSKLTEFRRRLRMLDPEMDARLVLWTGRQPVSNKGREAWRRLRTNYGFIKGEE